MPPQPQDTKKPDGQQQDKTYRVTKGVVGPWSQGSVFTESEFKRLHPIPDGLSKGQRELLKEDTYHGDLIGRLVALGVVEHAPDAAPTETPTGIGVAPIATSTAAIQAASQRVVQQREAEKLANATPEVAGSPPQTATPAAPIQHGGVQTQPQ